MGRYSHERLRKIYESTDGRCHICRRRLDFDGYGWEWEVDHSRPRSRGGSDSLRNLRPACVECNRRKGSRSSRSVRAQHGYRQAPRSRTRRNQAAVAGGLAGALLGAALGANPLLGAAAGFLLGRRDPD
jgi:5-methylcytosine-specific restriction endonuclease McrA